MKISTPPRALIFDWDNTLVDSWAAIRTAINVTREAFDKAPWTMEEVRQNCGLAARDIFPEWFGKEWEKAYDIFYKSFDDVRNQYGLQPGHGSHELLLWLKSRNIPSFVVSNKRGDYLRQESAQLKWNDLFLALIGSMDAPRDKPARDPVDMALKHGNLTPDASIWFVGDTGTDVQCARNAGCTPVFIGSKEEAEKEGVSLLFQDCRSLHVMLEKLFAG
ncbi:MAG: HAD hydrolase-like protein [Alphaproteobacteria bacterium]|nr:HAD hydrolase-like protein [Alphaproteobacteria bacterium]